MRRPRHEYVDGEEVAVFSVGHAEAKLYDRAVTDEELERWRLEDEARDARRIPLGFGRE